MPRLAEIHVFPVKAFAGQAPMHAEVEPCGLAGDRRWMVTDPDGRFLTQRAVARMALVQAVVIPAGIALSLEGHGKLEVARPCISAAPVPVTVWRDTVPATDAGPHASAWLTDCLGVPARLVYLQDEAARACSSAAALPGETVSFADGFPVLLTSLGSLADLNARLAHPVPISRFRANLVVDAAPAWAEDTWRLIRIGSAVFRVAKPCDRCIVTTIDQATGERPQRLEPLRTLGQFRQDARGIMFGQNLVPVALGRVSVGDPVEVLSAGERSVVPM